MKKMQKTLQKRVKGRNGKIKRFAKKRKFKFLLGRGPM